MGHLTIQENTGSKIGPRAHNCCNLFDRQHEFIKIRVPPGWKSTSSQLGPAAMSTVSGTLKSSAVVIV